MNICFFWKWRISRGYDSGKPMPGLVRAHIRSCASCGDFARTAERLGGELAREARQSLENDSGALAEKIIRSLPSQPLAVGARRRRWRIQPIPVLTAATALAAIGIGILLIPGKGITPPATDTLPILAGQSSQNGSLLSLAYRIESPLEAEMKSVKLSMQSAVQYLASCLDAGIPQ